MNADTQEAMPVPNPMTCVAVSVDARAALKEMAKATGVSQREFLTALLNYAYSIHKRPGSWEANATFNIETYTRPDSVADRWFK